MNHPEAKAADAGVAAAAETAARQRLEIVIESIRDGLLAVDRHWRVDLVNTCAASMLGRTPESLLHQDFRAGNDIALIEAVRQVMESRQPFSFEHFGNASGRWHDYRLSPSHDGGAVIYFVDITERKIAAERALLVAQHDALTGLANRRLLREEAERILAAARRQGHRLAVLFLDLDRFKPVNDSHGHEVGDKLLKAVARRIRRAVRTEDAIGRIGGDEFVAVLVGVRDSEDAAHVAANIVDRLGRPYRIKGMAIDIGVSIGISLYPTHGESVDVLFRRADAAMYAAKRGGRARFAFYTHDLAAAGAPELDQTMADRLRAALAAGEFSLDFQPVLTSAASDLVAAEAMIRWRPPAAAPVPPAEFLRVAEVTGLIHPIGDWLLREACLQQQRWAAEGLDIGIGVTLSGVQFRQNGFAQRVAAIVAETGIDPRRLLLNVGEATVTGNVDESIPVLHALRAAGIGVAIKNFGAGDSNIRALTRLPVDKIRLDRSFLHRADGATDLQSNGNGRAAADAIIGLVHSLHHEVVAEGVESEADMEYLRARGVQYCQGYLFAAPMPAAEFAAWWRERQAVRDAIRRPSGRGAASLIFSPGG